MRCGILAIGTVLLLSSAGHAFAEEMKVGGTGAAHGLMERLGEAFGASHPGDQVAVVPGLGSSGGIAALAEGVLQVAVSGRDLKPEEKAKGLESAPFVETLFLFVTSHPKRQRLTRADVVAIYEGTLSKWPDGKEIRPILRPRSDAAAAFVVASFEGMPSAMEKTRQRADVPIAATDQDNLDAAEKTPNSFAGMTLLQFTTETPRLRAIALDGVEASVEAMESGAYPLKMRLRIVTRAEPSPLARRFLDFLRSPDADRIIRESGAVTVFPKAAGTQ